MKTREQLQADYDKGLREIEIHERATSKLPDGIKPRMIHVSQLYGSKGSLVFGDSYHGNADKVTLPCLIELLKALPPVSHVKAKGTFTRFIAESFADSDANKEKGREDVTSIFPVTLKTNSCAGYSLKAEWFTEIDGELWNVDAYLADAYRLVTVHARLVEFVGGHRYTDTTASVNPALNPPEGGTWDKVKWGRGSEEWPHDFTIYHTQYDDDPVAWIERTIANLEAKAKG